jgi:hypothetical protein
MIIELCAVMQVIKQMAINENKTADELIDEYLEDSPNKKYDIFRSTKSTRIKEKSSNSISIISTNWVR